MLVLEGIFYYGSTRSCPMLIAASELLVSSDNVPELHKLAVQPALTVVQGLSVNPFSQFRNSMILEVYSAPNHTTGGRQMPNAPN
jgi:hypothetical protein